MLNVQSSEEGIKSKIKLGYEMRDYFDVSCFSFIRVFRKDTGLIRTTTPPFTLLDVGVMKCRLWVN